MAQNHSVNVKRYRLIYKAFDDGVKHIRAIYERVQLLLSVTMSSTSMVGEVRREGSGGNNRPRASSHDFVANSSVSMSPANSFLCHHVVLDLGYHEASPVEDMNGPSPATEGVL